VSLLVPTVYLLYYYPIRKPKIIDFNTHYNKITGNNPFSIQTENRSTRISSLTLRI